MVATIEIPTKTSGEIRNGAISLVSTLDSAELLTGTPVITSEPSGLIFSGVKVNTSIVEVSGRNVAIGKAVQFAVSSGESGETYRCKASVTTNATPAQVLEVFFTLKVVS
jgi:hypothetical protein